MEFAEQQARQRGIGPPAPSGMNTNEAMTESQAIYAHLGYQETSRHTENGYRRIYLEKTLPA